MRSPAPRLAAALVVAASLAAATPAVAGPPTRENACTQGAPELTALVGTRSVGRSWLRDRLRPLGATVGPALRPLAAYQVRFPSAATAARGLALLRADPRVRYAEPERVFTALETPADPMLRRQWALAKVGAPRAWNVEVGATSPVVVAVVDTGVAGRHPDLAGKLLDGANFVEPGAPPDDDHTHGTHVAGIVAAATNNRVGIAGMSWGARVLPVKALGADGGGSACAVAQAILYAAARGARVVNLSLGGPGPCPAAVQEAVDVAHRAGALSVAAAGNSGAAFNTSQAPANCERTLTVAATDSLDRPAPFSNSGDYVDVSAPGVDVLSTVVDPRTGAYGYAAFSGTSMATPVVAGLAALLASRHQAWTPDEIAERIRGTAADRGPRGWDERFGAGRVDAARALRP